MTSFILKFWPRFDNFITLFITKLGKPDQHHFIALIMAFIIYDGRKNIAGLNRALFAPYHTSSLWRFVGESEWNELSLEQIRLNELIDGCAVTWKPIELKVKTYQLFYVLTTPTILRLALKLPGGLPL